MATMTMETSDTTIIGECEVCADPCVEDDREFCVTEDLTNHLYCFNCAMSILDTI